MPIRFRCRYCNQLMGIARRKAGTPVSCPTCRAQVIVPLSDEEAKVESPPGRPTGDVPAPLFERSDFEAFLDSPVAEQPQPALAPPAPLAPSPFAAVIPSSPSFPLPPSAAARATNPSGLMLSPTQATWLTVVVILLVALAFGAGLLVGHYWMG